MQRQNCWSFGRCQIAGPESEHARLPHEGARRKAVAHPVWPADDLVFGTAARVACASASTWAGRAPRRGGPCSRRAATPSLGEICAWSKRTDFERSAARRCNGGETARLGFPRGCNELSAMRRSQSLVRRNRQKSLVPNSDVWREGFLRNAAPENLVFDAGFGTSRLFTERWHEFRLTSYRCRSRPALCRTSFWIRRTHARR